MRHTTRYPRIESAVSGCDLRDSQDDVRVAPTIAKNPESAILDQARTACPSVSEGPARAAATIQEARRAWGQDQGYKFIFISVLNYCSNSLNNVVANK